MAMLGVGTVLLIIIIIILAIIWFASSRQNVHAEYM